MEHDLHGNLYDKINSLYEVNQKLINNFLTFNQIYDYKNKLKTISCRFCDKIIVEDLEEDQKSVFKVNKWLSAGTQTTLSVTENNDLTGYTECQRLKKVIVKEHILFSLFKRYIQSFLKDYKLYKLFSVQCNSRSYLFYYT